MLPPMPCNARIGTIDRNVGAACCRPHAQNTRKSMNREPACCRLHAPRNANVGAPCCRPHAQNTRKSMNERAPCCRPHAQNTHKSIMNGRHIAACTPQCERDDGGPACCRPHAQNTRKSMNGGPACCRPHPAMRTWRWRGGIVPPMPCRRYTDSICAVSTMEKSGKFQANAFAVLGRSILPEYIQRLPPLLPIRHHSIK